MNIRWAIPIQVLAASTILCASPSIDDFAGTWVMTVRGAPISKLTLTAQNGSITGSMTMPRQVNMDPDGDIASISREQGTFQIQKAILKDDRLELTVDGDLFVMTLKDRRRASLEIKGMLPRDLDLLPGGASVTLATSLPEPSYPDDIRKLREQLQAMVAEDQQVRMAFDFTRMQAVDAKNRPELLGIFDRYGWVTNSLAGRDASHNFWLLVQHQTLEIQQRFLPAFEKAANDRNASMSDYAYLYDRVQTGLGKPQHWGTQARCAGGKPELFPIDDPAGVEDRRKALLLPPLSEYLQMDYMVKSCAQSAK